MLASVLKNVVATRYVLPLREGGSLPGLVEADDLGMYVVRFIGAGQGSKTLVAEVITGEFGRALGLPVPELALVEFDAVIARGEPDQEVQELLKASGGLNLGMDFLPGSPVFGPPTCKPHTWDARGRRAASAPRPRPSVSARMRPSPSMRGVCPGRWVRARSRSGPPEGG